MAMDGTVEGGVVEGGAVEGEGEGAPPVEEAPQVDPYEAKLAALQARTRGLEREASKYQMTAKQMEQRAAELEARLEAEGIESLKALPLKERAKRVGIDYGSWTKEFLQDPETPEQRTAREAAEKADRLEKQWQEREQAEQQAKAEAQKATVLSSIREAISAREDFTFTAALGFEQAVYDRFAEYAEKHGGPPGPDDQLEIVQELESTVRERVRGQLKSLAERDKSGDFRKMLTEFLATSNETAPSDGQATESRDPEADEPPRTLTTRHATNVGERDAQARRSAEERYQRALKRLEEAERKTA